MSGFWHGTGEEGADRAAVRDRRPVGHAPAWQSGGDLLRPATTGTVYPPWAQSVTGMSLLSGRFESASRLLVCTVGYQAPHGAQALRHVPVVGIVDRCWDLVQSGPTEPSRRTDVMRPSPLR